MAQDDVAVDLPGIDELSETYAVFTTNRERVALTPALGEFLVMSQVTGLRPILHTRWAALVSPFASLELGRLGAAWVASAPGGQLIDVMARREVSSFAEIPAPRSERPPWPVDPSPRESEAALGFELVVQHRAEGGTIIGQLAEGVFEAFGGEKPDAWGSTEPLTSRWNADEVSRLVQSQMPSTSVIRGTNPQGWWFTMTVDRSPTGLVERLVGGVILGPYDQGREHATELAESFLQQLQRQQRVTLASLALMNLDPLGFQGIRDYHVEIPIATMVGPWGLARAEVDIDRMRSELGAQLLGRAKTPTLLFRFDKPHQNPWQNFAMVAQAIGYSRLLAAFGQTPRTEGEGDAGGA